MGGSVSRQILDQRKQQEEQERQAAAARARAAHEAEIQRQRAEQEKIALEKRELLAQTSSLRAKLLDYTFPGMLPASSFPSHHKTISRVCIAVVGPTGSGKSAFINTSEMAMRNTMYGTCAEQTPGKEGTIILEDFLTEFNFSLLDTRGFFHFNSDEVNEFLSIFYGTLQTGEVIERSSTSTSTNVQTDVPTVTSGRLQKMVHSVIIVLKANDPRLETGVYTQSFKQMREHMRSKGMIPIAVVSHDDTLSTPQQREKVLEFAAAAVGCPKEDTFFIYNYTSSNKRSTEINGKTELQCLRALERAILNAEKFMKASLTRIDNRMKFETVLPDPRDWSTEQVLTWLEENELKKYETNFKALQVDGKMLVTLVPGQIPFNSSDQKRFNKLQQDLVNKTL